MQCEYDDIKPELVYVADKLEEAGFDYKAYNHGVQYNAEDINGIIQSFYPTTGTIVFHRSNSRQDREVKTIRDSNLDDFISYLGKPEEIQDFFADGG